TGSRPVSRPPPPWSTASPVIGLCHVYSNERCHQELCHEAIDRGCTLDREAVSAQSPRAGRNHEENTPVCHGARTALLSPPVTLAIDVFARIVAEIGRADDEDLKAVRPSLVASPRTGRDAHRVPLLELDDLVIELHPPAAAHDHVDLLLRLVRVAVRKAIAGRDALVAQAGLVELERPGRHAELQVRRAVEPGPDVLQVLLEVPKSERHGAILCLDCVAMATVEVQGVEGMQALIGQKIGPSEWRAITQKDIDTFA